MPLSRAWRATGLPIEAALDPITTALTEHGAVVITAAPGAGKSTVVPLALAEVVEGTVVVLEPRRLAARATAERLADLLGEAGPGDSVGLTMRGVRETSRHQRIEVVTEAILTRRLQADPELGGVGAVVFDEFHERSRHSDLGLAMALETKAVLRPDLGIVVMSATIDADPVAALIGTAIEQPPVPVVDVPGRAFDVATHHLDRPPRARWVDAMVEVIERAAGETDGDVLAFAPGRREIDDVVRGLAGRVPADVVGLHGGSPQRVQRAVLRPGPRRVIVASAVAETSITIPSVTAVVDGGLLRRAVVDASSGLGRLETGHATRFAADQRRGRAGRTGPGTCYRLWSVEDHRHLDDATPPELVDGDPLPVALELLAWGDPFAEALPLLDPPPRHRLESAHAQMRAMGALDGDRLTGRGSAAAALPLDLRAAMVAVRGDAASIDLAARLGRPDRSAGATTDLLRRLDRPTTDDQAELARQLRSRLGRSANDRRGPTDDADLAPLLATAWPDRVAMARPANPHRFLLASGTEVELGPHDPLVGSPFLVVADADGRPGSDGSRARVRAAVALSRADVLDRLGESVTWGTEVRWETRTDRLVAERVQRLGAIVLHRQPEPDPPAEAVAEALAEGIRRRGLDVMRWSDGAVRLRARLAWLHGEDDRWPDMSDDALLDRLDQWLDLRSVSSPADVARLDVRAALLASLDWSQRAELDALAPTSLDLPDGRQAPIRYDSGRPVCGVRLQKVLGVDRHPTVGPHGAPLVLELLTPADRPAQTTTDLPSFWRGSYAAVRADLRGRYPKHAWPEDPLNG